MKKYLIILSLKILIISCTKNIKLETSQNVDKLLQTGRQYYIESKYKLAKKTFKYIINNFKKDIYSVSWSNYELAMINYKEKNYKKAKTLLKLLLKNYPIPKQPRILALKILSKIENNIAHQRSSY